LDPNTAIRVVTKWDGTRLPVGISLAKATQNDEAALGKTEPVVFQDRCHARPLPTIPLRQAFKGALTARPSYPGGRDGLKNDDSLADNRVTAKAIPVGLRAGIFISSESFSFNLNDIFICAL